MRYADAWRTKARIVVFGCGQTTAGVLLAGEPAIVLEALATPIMIGDAIMRALAGWKTGVRHPELGEWDRLDEPFLQALGVKSAAGIGKGAKSITIREHDDGQLEFCPSRAIGRGRSVGTDSGELVMLEPGAKAEDIGCAALRAFDLCE